MLEDSLVHSANPNGLGTRNFRTRNVEDVGERIHVVAHGHLFDSTFSTKINLAIAAILP